MLRLITASLLIALLGLAPHAAGRPCAAAGGVPVVFPEIPGFVLTTEAMVYDASNLWEFIDGAAEVFVIYRFMDLHIAYYRCAGSAEIRAEVYRHKTPEDAFGMYSQERSPENHFLDIGTQGYAEEGIVNFLAGEYYVKLSSNDVGDTVQQSLLKVARAVAGALRGPTSWPGVLGLLPSRNRVPNSEQYVAESFLGYSFLRGAYVAQYREGGLFEVFVIPADSESGARAMLAALTEVNHSPVSVDSLRTIRDVHQGEMALLCVGRYLAGVVHCGDPAVRSEFVKILQSSLR